MEKQNELDEMKDKYRKQCRNGFIAGCIFMIAAIVFIVLSIVLHKPNVLYGVPLQMIAGITLMIINREGV